MICKLKARVNIHGVLNVETGYYVEEEEVEEEVNEDGDKKDPDVSLSEPTSVHDAFSPVSDQDSASTSSSASVGDDSRAYPAKRQRLEEDEETPSFRSAIVVPEFLEESIYEPCSLTPASQKAMETDKDAPKKTRKVKKQVRKGDLPISTGSASLDDSTKASLLEKESAMVMEDKLVADTEEKKNELEAYIYDLRAKLDEQYSEFASEDEKQTIKAKLEATEVRSPVSLLNEPY
jgi:heat shock protein 4